jgi:hypothetical protein
MHHHIYLRAMTFFLFGEALHALAQVWQMATKWNKSMKEVLYYHWVPIVVRAAICLFFFLGLLEGQIGDAVTALHITLPQWAEGILGLNVSSGFLAGLCGFAFDSGLNYIPMIQKLGIPPAIDAAPSPAVPATPPKVN